MKAIFSTMFAMVALVFSLQAQPPGGGDPEAMRARMKERVKPMLLDKTKVTDAEADKILDINFEFQMKTRPIRMDQSLSDDEKKAIIYSFITDHLYSKFVFIRLNNLI